MEESENVEKEKTEKDKDKEKMEKMEKARQEAKMKRRAARLMRKKPAKRISEEQTFTKEFTEIPGVLKIVLTPLTQKILSCVVGEDVTSEKPWKYVRKEEIADNLELHEESSDFLPIKTEIMKYPGTEMLVGYVPDESAEIDSFYVCVTADAKKNVAGIIQRIEKAQEERLKNSVLKNIGEWTSLGSEAEVRELQPNQSSRTLYEIEIDSRFPIFESTLKFKNRNVEDVHDGYVEILPGRAQYSNVYKRRIHTAVQAAALTRNNHAQTLPTYPTNKYTQYKYEYVVPKLKYEEGQLTMEDFVNQRVDEMCSQIDYNTVFDMYTNDYSQLVKNSRYVHTPEKIIYKEFMSFSDILTSAGKLISCAAWHPMWTDIVAVTYATVTVCKMNTTKDTSDPVNRIVHGKHQVLLWSLSDALFPKLRLTAPREITTLSFCPIDANVLIGGLSNGQVAIWDLKNKLRNVEEDEILTTAQQKYRITMFSLVNWMLNIRNHAIVQPAAVSSLEFSHTDSITEIRWLPPFNKVTVTGRYEAVPEAVGDNEQEYSKQFVTASADGTVFVWDLDWTPGGLQVVKAGKKSKRLEKRPSALAMDTSVYKELDRAVRPIFKLILATKAGRNIPIVALSAGPPKVRYEEENPIPNRQKTLYQRIIYRPIPIRMLPLSELALGTTEGDFIIGSWDGYDFQSGQAISSEQIAFKIFNKMYGSCVTDIRRSPFLENVYLAVGGFMFVIWKQLNIPLMARRFKHRYTSCSWSMGRCSVFYLTREDGSLEVWDLLVHSDKPIIVQSVSGKMLTGCYIDPFSINNVEVMGVADEHGSFRMFNIPRLHQYHDEEELTKLTYIFERDKERKTIFNAWQTQWNERNKEYVLKKKEEIEEQIKLRKMELQLEKDKAEEQKKLEELAILKQKALDEKPQPGMYSEWSKKRWEKDQEKRYYRLLLDQKKLVKEDLEKKQMPLIKIREQEEQKRQKQKSILSQQDKIFQETVSMFFPETSQIQTEHVDLDIPDININEEEMYSKLPEQYDALSNALSEYVDNNPFKYKFDWNKVLRDGSERRRTIDVALRRKNKNRKNRKESKRNLENIDEQGESSGPVENSPSEESPDVAGNDPN